MNTVSQRLGAEFLGTFWLVFGGCGSAVLAAKFPELGIGFTGVALAFGLTVVTMAYACTAPDFSDTRQRYAASCVAMVAAIQFRLVSAGLR
jgi:hypothetical protein